MWASGDTQQLYAVARLVTVFTQFVCKQEGRKLIFTTMFTYHDVTAEACESPPTSEVGTTYYTKKNKISFGGGSQSDGPITLKQRLDNSIRRYEEIVLPVLPDLLSDHHGTPR